MTRDDDFVRGREQRRTGSGRSNPDVTARYKAGSPQRLKLWILFVESSYEETRVSHVCSSVYAKNARHDDNGTATERRRARC